MVCMPPTPELGEEEALPEAGCEGCKRRPIGDPQWEITQALPIVGDVGALETGPEAYFDWVSKFFGPSLRELIAIKRRAGRPKDLAVIPYLESTLDELEKRQR